MAHTLSMTVTDGIGQQATADKAIVVSNLPPPGAVSSVWWIQPQASAGYGPPGSLIVAGSATGAGGWPVYLWWQDTSVGGPWNLVSYAPPPGSDGIWINSIPNVIYWHTYSAFVVYGGTTSTICNYPGDNSFHWCP